MRLSRRKVIVALAAGALLLAAAGVCRWFYLELWTYHGYTPRPFTPEAWAAADAEGRGHMVNNLLRSHPLPGRTAEEVRGLLGPPDNGGPGGCPTGSGTWGSTERPDGVLVHSVRRAGRAGPGGAGVRP